MRSKLFFGFGLVCAFFAAMSALHALPLDRYLKRPRVAVVFVIDQLPSGFLERVAPLFLPSKEPGIRRMLERGAFFPQTDFAVLQPMTCAGHATIATGTYSYRHGVVLNVWFESKSNKIQYCAGDETFATIGAERSGIEVGTAPTPQRALTLADALKVQSPASRVVAISLKDRSAILMGGSGADAAFWFDVPAWRWVSSRYYFPDGAFPPWADTVNSAAGSVAPEKRQIGSALGPRMTVDMAIAAMRQYKLGDDEHPDLLLVSFSSSDWVGHTLGTNGPEYRQILVDIDREIARLTQALAAEVPGGLDAVLLSLTSDHGVGPQSDAVERIRMQAHRVDEPAQLQELNAVAQKHLGNPPKEQAWVLGISKYNVWLNESALAHTKTSRQTLEEILRQKLLENSNVTHVITATDIESNRLPHGPVAQLIKNSYVPGRSGHVIIIYKPYVLPKGKDLINHLTPYSYDRFVPLAFLGPWIEPGVYGNTAELRDMAPTLAFLLGISPPTQSDGRVLAEILRKSK